MKSVLLASIMICSTATATLANEVEGDEAKKIVLTGEVLGMALFDEFFKQEFESDVGFIYGVKYQDKLFTCYNFNMREWFCESF